MIDTHTHLNFQAFKDDWREVVKRAQGAGVEKMIVVGTDLTSSKRAVEMAEENESLFAAVGIHPHHAKKYLDIGVALDSSSSIQNDISNKILRRAHDDMSELKQLAMQPKVVGIGEMGLDRHAYKNTKYELQNSREEEEILHQIQKQLLCEQVKLTRELDKPFILHSRESKDSVLEEILKQVQDDINELSGVFHCYEGSKKYLKRILEAGFYVSFTGNITYSQDRLEVAKMIPDDRLLIETDSPYMTPIPHRGERNEPKNVGLVLAAHAKSRNMSVEEMEKITTENANKLFGLSD